MKIWEIVVVGLIILISSTIVLIAFKEVEILKSEIEDITLELEDKSELVSLYNSEMGEMYETISVLESKNKELRKEVKQLSEIKKVSRGTINTNNYLGEFEATAYDLSFESCGKHPDHPQYGITASGTQAREGVIAVDPKVIPLGTKLYVEGIGEVVAEDKGGAIKGKKIDIFMEYNKACFDWGRRKVKVWLVK